MMLSPRYHASEILFALMILPISNLSSIENSPKNSQARVWTINISQYISSQKHL
jgi:hypothetical protein